MPNKEGDMELGDKEYCDALLIMANKETMLSEIIVWLRAKGLWEECHKDLITKTVTPKGN